MAFSVPHTAKIPFNLTEGCEIIIKGVVSPNPNRFQINLLCGPDNKEGENALHFNPRFDQNEVIRNHFSGNWGNEEKQGGFPFTKGAPCEVKIVVKNPAYQIFVNNTFFADFNHRVGKEKVCHLYVDGDIAINGISFTNTILNPPVPFTGALAGGLQPGRKIIINGIPTGGARFNVNLLSGSSFDKSEIALHFDVRFNFGKTHNQVVRTHRAGGSWGSEDTAQNVFPFAANMPFEMVIQVEPNAYKISVNNQHFTDFNHRIQPLKQVDHIHIQGDVRLTQIRL